MDLVRDPIRRRESLPARKAAPSPRKHNKPTRCRKRRVLICAETIAPNPRIFLQKDNRPASLFASSPGGKGVAFQLEFDAPADLELSCSGIKSTWSRGGQLAEVAGIDRRHNAGQVGVVEYIECIHAQLKAPLLAEGKDLLQAQVQVLVAGSILAVALQIAGNGLRLCRAVCDEVVGRGGLVLRCVVRASRGERSHVSNARVEILMDEPRAKFSCMETYSR